MRKSVRIGHLSTVYHTAFILMGTDLLSSRDIRAEWELYPSGPDIVNALGNGELDLAYIGLPPAIIGIDKGIPISCIGGGHIEGTVMIAGPEIRPSTEFADTGRFLDQFSGETIGTPPRGSIHDIILRDLLAKNQRQDIRVENYPWADLLLAAREEGEILAAAGTPALAVAGERFINDAIILAPNLLWPFNPSYGIVTTGSLSDKDLTGFLTAHEAASELIRSDPERCCRIVAEQTEFVDEAFVRETYRISPHYCSSLPAEYLRSTMAFSRTLHSLGSTSRVIPEEEIFDLRYIARVHPGRDHYRDGIARGRDRSNIACTSSIKASNQNTGLQI